MARRFEGTSPGEALTFQPEAIPGLLEDPNPSRYGPIAIDLEFCASLAKGQIEEVLVRMNPAKEPVLYVGHRRKVHIQYINDHPELWEEWGIKKPMGLRAKYWPVTQEQAEDQAVAENIQRADLTVVDKANLAQHLYLRGDSKESIRDRLKLKSVARVTQLLDLFSFGGVVLDLVQAGKLTEGAVRGLTGLPEDTVAEIVAQIQGGAKPHAVLAQIREQHRAKGKAKPRSGREIYKAFEELGGGVGADLTAWAKGDPTVGDLPAILARYQR